MSRYVTLQALRDYLSPDGSLGTEQDGLLQDCLDRAEGAISAYTRRSFAGTAGTVYYNRFSGGQVAGAAFYLDQDLYSLTGVYNGDGQTIPVGSVWLEPRNEGPPYRIVRLKSAYVWVWNTDSDVVFSGTWGYSTTPPADIQQATVRYAAYLYRGKDQGGMTDVAGFQEGGEVTIISGIPQDVRYLLAPYRSRTGGAV
ncbi:MAG TPA: hypothetical protein VFZ66_29530 [Herpetosiphonaceae bacterium]